VASHKGEKFPFRASKRWNDCEQPRLLPLRHNNCQTTVNTGRATPPHLQNQPDVAFVCFRHLGPKRETIKISAPSVKRSWTGFTRFHMIYMFILKIL